MPNRWDQWFSDANLRDDPRILAARHSDTAIGAAGAFLSRDGGIILDLGCGVGRDTAYFASCGLSVVGLDASLAGLRAAKRRFPLGRSPGLVVGDARCLPLANGTCGGVHCFGLLHEFTGRRANNCVDAVMGEIARVLSCDGLLVLAVLGGDPQDGLPAMRMFTRDMLETATEGWRPIEVSLRNDVSCTNEPGYQVWEGVYRKAREIPGTQAG
jgi:SAM-dependent methyltransferase